MEHSLSELYSVLIEVESALSGVVYNYTSDDDFMKIDNIAELQLVYWSEIIQRFHTCSATTILRLKKWYDAMDAAYRSHNYYGFCSSLRGLIEACSDSFYTLGRVIYPIADLFKHIRTSLHGKAEKPILSQSLEDELIHYVFARKLAASEKKTCPSAHNAKQVREYLDSVKDDSLDELYSELCQVSHPSTMSLLPFLFPLEGHGLTLHKENIDEELNKNLLNRHRKTIYDATVYALGTSLCGLKLINEFDIPLLESLKTDENAFKSLEGYPLWESIEQRVNKSLGG